MKKIALIVVVIALMASSFILGSRVGVEAHVYSDAKFKASLTTMYLQYIDKGKIDGLKRSLNSDLDIQLYLHAQGETMLLRYLFPELNVDTGNTTSAKNALVRAATYRKNNPSDFPSKSILESSSEEQRQRYQEFSNAVNRVVKQYGE